MVDRGEHNAALALRLFDYLRLVRSCSGHGTITFKVKAGDVITSEVTISDHRKYDLGEEVQGLSRT